MATPHQNQRYTQQRNIHSTLDVGASTTIHDRRRPVGSMLDASDAASSPRPRLTSSSSSSLTLNVDPEKPTLPRPYSSRFSRSMLDVGSSAAAAPRASPHPSPPRFGEQGPSSWPAGARRLRISATSIVLDSPAPMRIYELSNPLDGQHPVVGIEFVVHESGPMPTRERRRRHVYDVSTAHVCGVSFYGIKGVHHASYKDLDLSVGLGLLGRRWKVTSRMERRMLLRARAEKGFVIWKDNDGNVIARETEPEGGREPSLEITSNIQEAEMNLLVATWCAKLNLAAILENKEPLSVDRVKRALKSSSRSGGWILG